MINRRNYTGIVDICPFFEIWQYISPKKEHPTQVYNIDLDMFVCTDKTLKALANKLDVDVQDVVLLIKNTNVMGGKLYE